MKIIERIVDAITGETTDIEREMTPQEQADFLADKERLEKIALKEMEAQAKREAAAAKLSALGLDPDDLKALGL